MTRSILFVHPERTNKSTGKERKKQKLGRKEERWKQQVREERWQRRTDNSNESKEKAQVRNNNNNEKEKKTERVHKNADNPEILERYHIHNWWKALFFSLFLCSQFQWSNRTVRSIELCIVHIKSIERKFPWKSAQNVGTFVQSKRVRVETATLYQHRLKNVNNSMAIRQIRKECTHAAYNVSVFSNVFFFIFLTDIDIATLCTRPFRFSLPLSFSNSIATTVHHSSLEVE